MVEDLQSAWLLWVHCAAARANFFLLSVNLGKSPLLLPTMMINLGMFARCSVLIPQASLTLPGSVPPSRCVLVVWAQQRREVAIRGPLGQIAFGWFTRGTPAWRAPLLNLLKPTTLLRPHKVSFPASIRCALRVSSSLPGTI